MGPQTYKSPFALNDASDSYLVTHGNFQTEDSRNKDINFTSISQNWYLRKKISSYGCEEWDTFIFSETA